MTTTSTTAMTTTTTTTVTHSYMSKTSHMMHASAN